MNEIMTKTSQGKISLLDSKPSAAKNHPTVVFIHGHCTNKEFFKHQMRSPLLNDYRLIFLDLPGCGKSDKALDPVKVYNLPGFADIVKEVIQSLKLENIIVVGWSLGGAIALELTQRLSQLKGILITGTPLMENSLEGLSRGFKISDSKIGELYGKGELTEKEAQLLATVSGYDYSPEKRFIVDAILETDNDMKVLFPQSIMKGVGANQVQIVAKWPNPIAVIAGEDDNGINNEYIINEVAFCNLWRNQVFMIPHAGHAVFMEQPEKFNTILNEFLTDIFYIEKKLQI